MKPWRAAEHKVRKDHSPEHVPESLPATGSAPIPSSAPRFRRQSRSGGQSAPGAIRRPGNPAVRWPWHSDALMRLPYCEVGAAADMVRNAIAWCVSGAGLPLDRHNVLRRFRTVVKAAGLAAQDWAARELRHSFVSLLSDDGVPLESISRLVGHRTTTVTETVYRKQLRPVIEDAATAMNRIGPSPGSFAWWAQLGSNQ